MFVFFFLLGKLEFFLAFNRDPWNLCFWLDALLEAALLHKVEGEVMGRLVEAVVPIIPVFGGTSTFHEVLPSSNVHMCGPGSISASTMDREFWRELIPATVWQGNLALQVRLAKLAGHMRAVEWFVDSVLKPGNVDWAEVVAKGQDCSWAAVAVENGLECADLETRQACGSWLVKRCRPQLIAAVVLGAVVPFDGVLDGETLDDIVRCAPVVIDPVVIDRAVRVSTSAIAMDVMCSLRAEDPVKPFLRSTAALVQFVYGDAAPMGLEAFKHLCAQQLVVQKMGFWVLGHAATCKDVFRGALFDGASESMQFSKHRHCDLGLIRIMHEFPGSDPCSGPVFVKGKGAPAFSDVVSRLLSNVDEFLVLRRFLEDDFSVSAVTKEVRNVSKTLGLWNRVAPGSAGAVVVFISLGRHAWTAPAARFPLPTIVVCRGHGLEELFGSLLDCVILRCRTFFFQN